MISLSLPEKSRMHPLMIMLGSAMTSFSAVFVKISHAHPDAAGFYRNFFGLCALSVLLVIRRERPVTARSPLFITALCGFFFFLDLVVWHRSIGYLGPGLATFLGNFQVIILAAVSVFVLGEKTRGMFIVSVALALAGLLMVLNPFTFTFHSDFGKGTALGLATSVCYAGYLITLRHAKHERYRASSVSVMWVTSLFCAAFFAVELLATGGSFAIADASSGASLVAYGVIGQCAGWVIITRSLPHVKTSLAGLLLLSQPALSYLWDVLFFGHKAAPLEVAGVAIAFGAIYLGSRSSR